MVFEKAEIPVQKAEEYGKLHGVLERAFAPAEVEKLLKRLQKDGIRVRDWETVLKRRVLEALDTELKKSGQSAEQLYGALAVSDQGLIREEYLTRLEAVAPELRHKYNKIYAYY